jgi:hypothetical protein
MRDLFLVMTAAAHADSSLAGTVLAVFAGPVRTEAAS